MSTGYLLLTDEKKSELKSPPIPAWMLKQARIFERLFVRVPLNECEKLPDPDYGL